MAHVAKAKLGTISVWLTGVALFGVIASAMWLALLEPQDWNTLVPFLGIVFVARPIAFIAVVLSAVSARLRRAKPAIGRILMNTALIAAPWIWFASVT